MYLADYHTHSRVSPDTQRLEQKCAEKRKSFFKKK